MLTKILRCAHSNTHLNGRKHSFHSPYTNIIISWQHILPFVHSSIIFCHRHWEIIFLSFLRPNSGNGGQTHVSHLFIWQVKSIYIIVYRPASDIGARWIGSRYHPSAATLRCYHHFVLMLPSRLFREMRKFTTPIDRDKIDYITEWPLDVLGGSTQKQWLEITVSFGGSFTSKLNWSNFKANENKKLQIVRHCNWLWGVCLFVEAGMRAFNVCWASRSVNKFI